jgi:hypothetical protein
MGKNSYLFCLFISDLEITFYKIDTSVHIVSKAGRVCSGQTLAYFACSSVTKNKLILKLTPVSIFLVRMEGLVVDKHSCLFCVLVSEKKNSLKIFINVNALERTGKACHEQTRGY